MPRIEKSCSQVYIRPLGRGIVLDWDKERNEQIYLDEWLEAAVREYSLSGGSVLHNVRVSIEWDKEEMG